MPYARYIPLDASESAVLQDNQSLLPLPVYQKLAGFIIEALKKISDTSASCDLNSIRSHNAVSVDGSRGTGKTSVLVNLKLYLKNDQQHPSILNDIHILEPVDPTLLEESESLFLHIIVAALLSDKEVKLAQSQFPEKSHKLNKCLESLAHALASVENQRTDYGMDKLRALFGNRHLADCVQTFFKETLNLLGKKLLVLPIDDVDTSLNRAFENLEIIRRYLTTPYVLPVVSGDRSLYNEVTWRDFHGRLTKDSAYQSRQASIKAQDLATEYQRKLLPLPRRLVMPDVEEYLRDQSIELRHEGKKSISLNVFYSWLQIFITGPVNGLEGSLLPLPVPSIRALTQLINHCGKLIPELPSTIRLATNELQMRRLWQMPDVVPTAIEKFHIEYNQQSQRAKDRDYAQAYQQFARELEQQPASDVKMLDNIQTSEWEQTLLDYFRFETNAGAVYLVLMAYRHWHSLSKSEIDRQKSIFDTPLFQPLLQSSREFEQFDKNNDFSEWIDRLQGSLPESWFTSLKSRNTILPYPIAEVGIISGVNWRYWESLPRELSEDKIGEKAILLASLSMQYNFYNTAKQSFMLNIGRIFEIIIASLVSEISFADMQRIAQNASFFSASAVAPTKTVSAGDSSSLSVDDEENGIENRPTTIALLQDEQLTELHREIVQWRDRHGLKNRRFSPWMVYKVFNKVYSQFANSKNLDHGFGDLKNVIETVGRAFYATWSAFGSFEKGRLFGLPEIVATVNLNKTRNFEKSNDHFNVNLGPFVVRQGQNAPEKNKYGASTRTASYFLADHPIRRWIDEALSILTEVAKDNVTSSNEEIKSQIFSKNDSIPRDARIWLRNQLGLEEDFRLTDKRISEALNNFPPKVYKSLLLKMESLYPNYNLTARVRTIIDMKEAES